MKSYRITYEDDYGWVIEIRSKALPDRNAFVLAEHDDVREFINEMRTLYENAYPRPDW